MLAQITNLPPDTVGDIAKVFHDFGVTVSASTIIIMILAIKATAGWIRNFALKNKTAETSGVIERAVAHIAGNSLPSQPIVQATGQAVVPENPPQVVIPAAPVVILPEIVTVQPTVNKTTP
jgi:hypothetical protein